MKWNEKFGFEISEIMIHITTDIDITHWTMKIFNVLLQYT